MARKNVARAAGFIAIFTLLSKILGIAREAMIAAVYGPTMEVDTYKGAITIALISMTILGGALNTSLVPIFTEIGQEYGEKRKKEFFRKIYTGVFFLTIGILLVIVIFAKPLTKMVLWKFQGPQLDMAVYLVRLSAPMVIFMGMTYVFQGYLHSEQCFGPGALMGIPFNLMYFIYLGFFGKRFGMDGLMLASVSAAAMQALIQVPAVLHRKNSLRLKMPVHEPYLNKTMHMLLPIALGTSVIQIDVVVDKALASGLEEGSLTVLDLAFRLNEGIVAVFIAALVTVVFPMLSRAFQERNREKLVGMINRGITTVMLITIPATLGVVALSKPVVEVVFQRGNFDAHATLMTTSALMFYCMGMTGVGIRLFLSKVFYSLQKTTIPMYNGILTVACNVVLNFIFIRFMAHAGLALATGISVNIGSMVLYKAIHIRFPEMNTGKHLRDILKITLASAVMGGAVYGSYEFFRGRLPDGKLMTLGLTLACIAFGALIYGGCIYLLKVEEVDMVIEKVKEKLGRHKRLPKGGKG